MARLITTKDPRPLLGIATLLALSLVLAACGGTQAPGVVSVRISPESIKAEVGQQIVVSVDVNPEGRGISGGEINLSFDPEIFTLLGVTPGGLFGSSPLVGVEAVDNQSGTLVYALARRGPTSAPTQASTFAELTFQVSGGVPAGRYDLLVTRVGLADEAFRDILDIELTSATVEL